MTEPHDYDKYSLMPNMSVTTTVLSAQQRSILALWYEVNASLSAYHKLLSTFENASSAWAATSAAWREQGIHAVHRQRHEQREATLAQIQLIEQALIAGKYQLIFKEQPEYPTQLHQIYDPPPLLFCRGNCARLQQVQIAMVGSRKPTAHAQKTTFDMAQYLAQYGYVITSGLAMGVDKCAHLGALSQVDADYLGRTVGVMGTGIDVCYPNHHDMLFGQIIEQGGCLISELLPHTLPHKHTFPRRNRLVAGLSLATIVTEAALKSGSLITARLTSEQGKQVFAIPSHIDNHNAEGCHHLIREGATLIYHPQQVIDEVGLQLPIQPYHPILHAMSPSITEPMLQPSSSLSKPRQSITKQAPMTVACTVPKHLDAVYQQLDWHGQDLDALLLSSGLTTPQLLGQLMELELIGAILVQGGRYLRV